MAWEYCSLGKVLKWLALLFSKWKGRHVAVIVIFAENLSLYACCYTFFMFGTVQLRRHIMKVCYSNVSSRPRAITVQGIKQKIVLMNLLVVLWCVEKAQFGEISIGRAGCTKHLWWSMSVQLDFNVKLGPVNQSAYSLKFGTATIGGWAKQLITVCTVRLRCQNMVDI